MGGTHRSSAWRFCEWVYDHVGSDETAKVDGVWVQVTHDATSDGFLISAKDPGW